MRGEEVHQNVMVYDLGGGIFDVSILYINSGVFEVLATAGNNRLGGDDFDSCFVDYLIKKFIKGNRVALTKDLTSVQRVKEVKKSKN